MHWSDCETNLQLQQGTYVLELSRMANVGNNGSIMFCAIVWLSSEALWLTK